MKRLFREKMSHGPTNKYQRTQKKETVLFFGVVRLIPEPFLTGDRRKFVTLYSLCI